jgi:hypothetical protein
MACRHHAGIDRAVADLCIRRADTCEVSFDGHCAGTGLMLRAPGYKQTAPAANNALSVRAPLRASHALSS